MTLCKLGLVLSLMWGMASGALAQWTDGAFLTSAEQSINAFPTIESAIDYDRFSSATDAGAQAANSNSAILTQPWWIETQSPRLRPTAQVQGWDLDQLIWLAVEHSPWVQGVLVEPQIFQAQAAAATGQFDPNAFVDSIFRDTSDPVGNTLITGSAGRLNDHIWNNSSGLRAKNTRGGVSELSQDFNFKDSNSNFFLPSNQADTKMVMRYTQPLLRGAGVTYNRSTIVIASLRAEESMQDAIRQIQSHAFSIITAYWELVAARASYRQIERGLSQLEELHSQLVGRADIDTLKSQQLRAESAIYKQRAAQAKALAQMHAAEANLRAAVAAPQLREQTGAEMIPLTLPADWKGPGVA
jgi:hypothetical protein